MVLQKHLIDLRRLVALAGRRNRGYDYSAPMSREFNMADLAGTAMVGSNYSYPFVVKLNGNARSSSGSEGPFWSETEGDSYLNPIPAGRAL